jgi:hypothetical protein
MDFHSGVSGPETEAPVVDSKTVTPARVRDLDEAEGV